MPTGTFTQHTDLFYDTTEINKILYQTISIVQLQLDGLPICNEEVKIRLTKFNRTMGTVINSNETIY